ncbi:hypothetical protein IFM89_017616 [Coptis chinensis]|uniref:Beta-amylase n=1 Tax=Coptis chinensis TaxID=261450 RepID=A0A835LDY4_9MAGN|nr:hypothetical protein IFM89_017616 [Coptis chinensis]
MLASLNACAQEVGMREWGNGGPGNLMQNPEETEFFKSDGSWNMAYFFLNGMHWHYGTESHPSELTAGYYNTSIRDGYLPIARLFGRYGVILCCVGFEMRDSEEKQMHPLSSSEGLLRQILLAARASDLPLDGENSAARLKPVIAAGAEDVQISHGSNFQAKLNFGGSELCLSTSTAKKV